MVTGQGQSRPFRRTTVVTMTAVLAMLCVSGCRSPSADSVSSRVSHFYQALARQDAASACADLAPSARTSLEEQEGMPCHDAILEQPLVQVRGAGEVHVYGSMAQVTHRGQAVYLSRFAEGWLLTAVGCGSTTGDQPRTCTIEAS